MHNELAFPPTKALDNFRYIKRIAYVGQLMITATSKILHPMIEKTVQTLGPIKRQKTLTEQAADAIRTRIVEGQFEFGEALSEITLANELGVSKTPVREAFQRLARTFRVDVAHIRRVLRGVHWGVLS